MNAPLKILHVIPSVAPVYGKIVDDRGIESLLMMNLTERG